MNIVGDDYLQASISQDGYFIKLVFNEQAAHFFPYTTEHRDASLAGLCYRDDSIGNALAATIKPTQIDVRLHNAFSAQHVKTILERLELNLGKSGDLKAFDVYYGGKNLTTIWLSAYPDHQRPPGSDPSSRQNATNNVNCSGK